MSRRTIVSSVSPGLLDSFKTANPGSLIRSALISGASSSPLVTVRQIGTVYKPTWRSLTPAQVQAYQSDGVRVWVWPNGTTAEYAASYRSGAAAIVVDDAKAARAWLVSSVHPTAGEATRHPAESA
jgi:glycerophosphoryl diester phosphodiesterase